MNATRARAKSTTRAVVVGTSFELLVLLYRQVQADYGLPANPDIGPDLAVPARLRTAADWFFRGDIALGMNVIPLACSQGWHTVDELATGLAATAPEELTSTMLRSPDTTAAGQTRRDRQVAAILDGAKSPASLLEALESERFDTAAVTALLDDPAGAAKSFTQFISAYARVIGEHEQELRAPLAAAADHAERLLADAPLDDAAKRLFPQWSFHQLDAYEAVVLIPSQIMAPFLTARLVTERQALIVFPVPLKNQLQLVSLTAGLKAIAHQQRLEILRIAASTPITGHALARALGVTEATVHHHTSLLRAAGLLTSHRDAQRVYHTANREALDDLIRDTRFAVTPPSADAET